MVEASAAGVRISPGAFHLPGFLTSSEQLTLVELVIALGSREGGFYRPSLRSGAKMRLEMMCLGRHWNARTYQYEQTRTDVDRLPVQPMPQSLRQLASQVARTVGMEIDADVALINRYSAGGRLGVHRDSEESAATIASGVPVVSLSLGDDAAFLFGGRKRSDAVREITLASGDAFVFGGEARLAYHGIARVYPGTGPDALGLSGRLSITFRQF